MMLNISISSEAETRLRQQAAAAGKEPAAYAAQLVEQAVSQQVLEELLAPLRREFAASGTTDEALIAQITEARDAYRNQQ